MPPIIEIKSHLSNGLFFLRGGGSSWTKTTAKVLEYTSEPWYVICSFTVFSLPSKTNEIKLLSVQIQLCLGVSFHKGYEAISLDKYSALIVKIPARYIEKVLSPRQYIVWVFGERMITLNVLSYTILPFRLMTIWYSPESESRTLFVNNPL